MTTRDAAASAISIGGREIGRGQPPFIVAEMSGNHNGELGRAVALLDAAKAAGADAVKLQTYTADTMTIDSARPEFRIKGGLWDGRTLYELYQEAHTPWEWHPALFEHARSLGLTIFSSPFDETAVDLLESLGAPAYKIASFEVVDIPLIQRVARTGKPMIISTGMANLVEIGEAVETARAAGCRDIVLLHCISAYPAPASESDLRTMPDLAERFGVTAGLSDHSMGTAVAVASVALGASLIEKHFTLHRADGGPDSAFSLEADELAMLVRDVRTAWEALGTASYDRRASEESNVVFRRSLYVVADVAAGQRFDRTNVRAIRPGYGLPPKYLDEVLGRRARVDIARGTALERSMVE